jgi:[ribosomal protein S5]-alanine N-acetyltransferase
MAVHEMQASLAGPRIQCFSDGLPTLEASSVSLREPRLSDAARLAEVLTTEEVTRFISRPPADRAGFEQFIAWIQQQRVSGQCFCYAIVPGGERDAVGLIQFRLIEPEFGTVEWGFALGQAYWGSGLFMAAARLALEFAFTHHGVHRVEARAAVENARGVGVLKKLDFEFEGVVRSGLVLPDGTGDQSMWSLLAEDWKQHPESCEVTARPAPPEAAYRRPVSRLARAWRDGVPPLVGDRVTLRELQDVDAPTMLAMMNDDEVRRFIPRPPQSADRFREFIEWTHRKRQTGSYLCFGMVPAGQDHAVGLFQVRKLDPLFHTAEWGFALGRPYWGTGLFEQGAQLLLGMLFDTIRLRRLEARAAVANGRGNGALQKVGASREGQLRRSFLLNGQYSDDALWSVVAADWRRRQGV